MDLSDIDDEQTLVEMLEDISTEDIDRRKQVRARLLQLKKDNRQKRDEKLDVLMGAGQERLKEKKKESEEQKRRTLAAYDAMAHSAPAGGQKSFDMSIYSPGSGSGSGCSTPTSVSSSGLGGGGKRDLVEEAIRSRAKESEDQKKRMLAAFEFAAKSAPAGVPREVDFDSFKRADVSGYEPSKPQGAATYASGAGIPRLSKAPVTQPSTPASPYGGCMSPLPGVPNAPFPKPIDPEAHIDSMERAIRKRQKELSDAKRNKLAAYDLMAKLGPPGPKDFSIDEFRDINVPEDMQLGTDYRSCTAFRDGRPQMTTPATPINSMRSSRQPSLGPSSRQSSLGPAAADSSEESTTESEPHSAPKPGPSPRPRPAPLAAAAGPKPVNPMQKFQQMDSGSSSNGETAPVKRNFGVNPRSRGGMTRNPTDVKDMLLRWARAKTRDYEGVQIENFSSSWADGMAFAALIHHFFPDAYDMSQLSKHTRKQNFELAFRTAEERADIYPLIEVEDMLLMGPKPDWKCVFTYVQGMYRKLRELED